MADALKDIEAAILEVDVFQFERPDGEAVDLVVTLLDMQSDTIAISKMVRDHAAQAFGMLFFKSASVPCPQAAVIWERFDDGLQVTPSDDEADLFNETLQNMSLQAVKTFLEDTAQKDPQVSLAGSANSELRTKPGARGHRAVQKTDLR